jgi:putative colanic acid biosynthesis UDP-glucose lipid carrier transferase
LPFEEYSVVKEVISVAERNGVRIRFIPNWYSMINRNFVVSNLGSIPMLDIRNVPLYQYENRFWKRAFDLLLSTLMLIMLSPLMLVVAALIKLESRGPIFYRPVRLGVNGVPFTMFKFRSMVQSDDAVSGVQSTVKDDVRITKLGRFIRKTNIDELPQLFNVIRNEMSLVGPRPHRVYLNRDLQQKMRHYMVRHLVKPGITGWAQVNGWRGPTENRLQYMGRTLHDLWYIENWTFWLDLYILFLTIFGRKARKNAF